MQKKGMLHHPKRRFIVASFDSISALKSKARALKRARNISWCEALDLVARQAGYASWSLLAAKRKSQRSAELWERLDPGDLLLVGARRGQGKTRCAAEIALSAMRRGRRAWFFSLENEPPDLARIFEAVGARAMELADKLVFDGTDRICADYILEKVGDPEASKSVVVIDYLQLLDQRRSSPELHLQVEVLKAFARRTGCILVFIAQVARSFDDTVRRIPDVQDLRLLNPVDLRSFDKALFLHAGTSRLSSLGR
jgi:replicative DNA helicase